MYKYTTYKQRGVMLKISKVTYSDIDQIILWINSERAKFMDFGIPQNKHISSQDIKIVINNKNNHWALFGISGEKPSGFIGLNNIKYYHKCATGFIFKDSNSKIKINNYDITYISTMLYVSAIIKKYNLNSINIWIVQSNRYSIAFTENIGFKKVGILRECFTINDESFNTVILDITKKDFLEKFSKLKNLDNINYDISI